MKPSKVHISSQRPSRRGSYFLRRNEGAPVSYASSLDVLTLRQSDLPGGGRFLVVGDIHGEYEMLLRTLASARYDETRDILIAVGDLIDRGPSCVEVVKFFIGHTRRFCVLGNHEGYLLEALGGLGDTQYWFAQGGEWAKQASRDDLQLFRAEMAKLPLVVELILENPAAKFGIVHGEVPVGSSWGDSHRLCIKRNEITGIFDTPARKWFGGRDRIKVSAMVQEWMDAPEEHFPFDVEELTTSGVDLVISGHSIMPHRLPYRSSNHLWIDTGAFEHKYGGRLTIVDPVSEIYWQTSRCELFGPCSLRQPQIWRLGDH